MTHRAAPRRLLAGTRARAGRRLVTSPTRTCARLTLRTRAGTSDEHITLAQCLTKACTIDGSIIVTTPQEVSLLDVRKEINFCAKTKIPVLGVVEARSPPPPPRPGRLLAGRAWQNTRVDSAASSFRSRLSPPSLPPPRSTAPHRAALPA